MFDTGLFLCLHQRLHLAFHQFLPEIGNNNNVKVIILYQIEKYNPIFWVDINNFTWAKASPCLVKKLLASSIVKWPFDSVSSAWNALSSSSECRSWYLKLYMKIQTDIWFVWNFNNIYFKKIHFGILTFFYLCCIIIFDITG